MTVSFLLRHDHGLYAAAATALTVLAVHWRDGALRAARQLALLAALCFVLVLPFLVYVQANIGLWRYLQLGVGTYQGEASRTGVTLPAFTIASGPLLVRQPPEASDLPGIHIRWAPHVDEGTRLAHERAVPLLHAEHIDDRTWRYRIEWNRTDAVAPLFAGSDVEDVDGINRRTLELDARQPFGARVVASLGLRGLRFGPPIVSLSENAGPFLFYSAWLLPLLAFVLWLKTGARDRTLIVPVICALGLICALGFQRDEPAIRTPDVFGTYPILFAWVFVSLVAVSQGPSRRLLRAAVVTLAILVTVSVLSLGRAGEMLTRTTALRRPVRAGVASDSDRTLGARLAVVGTVAGRRGVESRPLRARLHRARRPVAGHLVRAAVLRLLATAVRRPRDGSAAAVSGSVELRDASARHVATSERADRACRGEHLPGICRRLSRTRGPHRQSVPTDRGDVLSRRHDSGLRGAGT